MGSKRAKLQRKQIKKVARKLLKDSYSQFFLDIFALKFRKRLKLCMRIMKPRRQLEIFCWIVFVVTMTMIVLVLVFWNRLKEFTI